MLHELFSIIGQPRAEQPRAEQPKAEQPRATFNTKFNVHPHGTQEILGQHLTPDQVYIHM